MPSGSSQALAATGRIGEASDRFDQLAALASPLGLYAEEVDPVTHAHLGNYPQALTHSALVQAALALRDRCGDLGDRPEVQARPGHASVTRPGKWCQAGTRWP